MKQYVLPKRIIKSKNVFFPENLKVQKPLQPILRREDEWISQIAEVDGVASITIDYGKEMNGGIRLVVCGIEDIRYKDQAIPVVLARIRFGESLAEVNSELGEKNSNNEHSIRDITTQISMFSSRYIGDTGFRYVRIDFLEPNAILYLQSVVCVNEIFRKSSDYKYTGSDTKIANIFQVAKRTIDLCTTEEYVWDGVKRDRLVWTGDLHPEILALTTLYGRVKQIENSLNLIRDGDTWLNGIPSYNIWFVLCIADYYKETHCREFVLDNLEYVLSFIDQIDDCVTPDGELNFPWYFVDWPSKEHVEDSKIGVHAMCLWMANSAKELLENFNVDTSKIENLIKKLSIKPIGDSDLKQIIALKYFALGKITDQEYKKLIKGGAKGLSTFMSYYILSAIASVDKDKAIEIMKEYFGAMIDLGATTFWEDFDMEWADNTCKITKIPKRNQKSAHGDFGKHCYVGYRCSLCHGWSAGIIKFIKEFC